MNIGLSRIEWTGLARLPGLFSGRPENSATRFLKARFVWLPAALIAGLGAWTLLSGYASKPAASEPVGLAAAAVRDGSASEPATMPLEAIAPVEAAPIDGLKIASQSWQRGGLGSKALVTFTLRNSNDFAVKDIEISCAFARRDGSHLTDRSRTIHDIVNMKSRKTFARMPVGFVNINADRAKCSLVAASHI